MLVIAVRLVVLASLLLTFVVGALPVSAQVAPTLTVSPASGPAGTDVTLHGSGFPPLAAVYLWFGQEVNGDQDCRDASTGSTLQTAFADERGAFTLTFAVPGHVASRYSPPAATAAPAGAPSGPTCILATSAPGLNVQQGFTVTPSPVGTTASCDYILGFAALHALIPGQVGTCLQNEQHTPVNGDGLQATTGGLLVWRKADNWTAFTDGYRTWVNGPFGLEERLNSQHFAWEGPGSGAGPTLTAPAAVGRLDEYYADIDKRDFSDAYALWHEPNQSYGSFVAGYASTFQVSILVGPPQPDSGLGSAGVLIPAVLLARQTDGSISAFAGCYGLTAPRPQPPARPYGIVTAAIHAAPSITSFAGPGVAQALGATCA